MLPSHMRQVHGLVHLMTESIEHDNYRHHAAAVPCRSKDIGHHQHMMTGLVFDVHGESVIQNSGAIYELETVH